MGVSQVGFVLLKPKRVHYSSIQRDHQYHRDYAGNEEPGGTVGFGEPFPGPVFHAEIGVLIKVDCQEEGNVKNHCRNPRSRNDDLELINQYEKR